MNIRISELESYLEKYLGKGKNVLITGLHGIGKTHIMKKVLVEKGIKFYYCSGATLDPWVDFIGIPKEAEREGGKVLEFLRPETLGPDVEVIIIDEYNRAPKAVRNACMELIQFKTLNGVRFSKLKCIWAAINPDDFNEINYDVEKLDHTQKDRFEIHLNLPYEINKDYFEQKYGEYINVQRLDDWWANIGTDSRLLVSPRRIEMAIQQAIEGEPLSHIFPESVSTLGFDACLKMNNELFEAIKDFDRDKIREIVNDPMKAHTAASTLLHVIENEDWLTINPQAATCLVSELQPETIATNYRNYTPLVAGLLKMDTTFFKREAVEEYSLGMNNLICATLFNLALKEETRSLTLNAPIIEAIRELGEKSGNLATNHKVLISIYSAFYQKHLPKFSSTTKKLEGMPFDFYQKHLPKFSSTTKKLEGMPFDSQLLFLHKLAQKMLFSKSLNTSATKIKDYAKIVAELLNRNDSRVDLDTVFAAHIRILKYTLKKFPDVISVIGATIPKDSVGMVRFPIVFIESIYTNLSGIRNRHKELNEHIVP